MIIEEEVIIEAEEISEETRDQEEIKEAEEVTTEGTIEETIEVAKEVIREEVMREEESINIHQEMKTKHLYKRR